MDLNQLFDEIEKTREAANWRAAFGEPQEIDGRTIIPVASVGYGFGLGFGQGEAPAETEESEVKTGEGGGGGGGASAKPLGVIVVTEDEVCFEEAVDATKIAVAAMLTAGFVAYQFARTLRALRG